jgi:hypothetical protein
MLQTVWQLVKTFWYIPTFIIGATIIIFYLKARNKSSQLSISRFMIESRIKELEAQHDKKNCCRLRE